MSERERKFHYVYRISNITENKHYYGKRSTSINPIDDIGKQYFSSSKDKDFITEQHEHPERFKYKVIRQFATSFDAIVFEIKLHNKFDVVKNPNFYNRAKQTSIGFDTTGIEVSEKIKSEMSKRRLGRKHSKETKEKIGNAHRGKPKSEEHKIAIENAKSELWWDSIRKPKSEVHKIKIGNAHRGKPKSAEHVKNIKIGWENMTDETREIRSKRLSEKAINEQRYICIHCNKYFKAGMLKRWHGEKCKQRLNLQQ